MIPWSDNVLKQHSSLHPKKIDPSDFSPSQRAFPFADVPTLMPKETVEELQANGHFVPLSPSGKDCGEDTGICLVSPFIDVCAEQVTFRMQRGPIKEHGVNGCQIDDMVKFVADTIAVLNKKFPCRENSLAITKLEEAWLWLQARKMDREARQVEGLDKE